MKTKLAKAQRGKVVKTKVTDPEGNIIKTKENTKTGRKVTKVKYADVASSGMKRERTVTPGLTRRQMQINEMYAKNPKAAKEDNFTPFVPGQNSYKTGGMVNANSKVSALASASSKGVKSGVNTKASSQKNPKGRVGGTSTAPKTATPKAKYGGAKKK